ncbi:MAG: sporulation integral membrane protein YtvI [Lachnospiraceae bacterium]
MEKGSCLYLGKIAVVTILVYLGFRFFLPLFFPFLLAYLIACLLKRPVRFLAKRLKIKPAIGGGILLFLFVLFIGGGLVYAISRLIEQLVLFFGNYALYQEEMTCSLERICCYCDSFLGVSDGSTFRLLGRGMEKLELFFAEEFLPSLTKKSIQAAVSITEIAGAILIVFVAVILFLVDMTKEQNEKKQMHRPEWQQLRRELSNAGIAYLKTQVTLMLLVSIACSAGFFLLGNPYALLFGVGVGIFDAFPVLGSGLILVPWAIVSFIRGNLFDGAVLLTMYGICQFLREYVEPKLLGGKIGIRPVYSLMAVYIGYELFGFFGIFLGPIGLVLIRSVMSIIK